ncbi:uncharacterized protein FYW61_011813 [Anableps anableps]
MSGRGTPPGGLEGPVQPGLYRWHRYRKPWRVFEPQPCSEQPLDRYQWRTSEDQNLERPHLFGLLKTSTLPRRRNQNQDPDKHGSLRRIIPFFRSMSEPSATGGSDRTPVRKADSDAERRTPSVSSFISTLSRRISRVLRDEPEPESGRRMRRFTFMVLLLSEASGSKPSGSVRGRTEAALKLLRCGRPSCPRWTPESCWTLLDPESCWTLLDPEFCWTLLDPARPCWTPSPAGLCWTLLDPAGPRVLLDSAGPRVLLDSAGPC